MAQLTLLDEKRVKSIYHSQLYQKRIGRAYNKKIKPGKIKEGDLVLKVTKPIITDPRGKFRLNWEGPYLVKKLFSKGATMLSERKIVSRKTCKGKPPNNRSYLRSENV